MQETPDASSPEAFLTPSMTSPTESQANLPQGPHPYAGLNSAQDSAQDLAQGPTHLSAQNPNHPLPYGKQVAPWWHTLLLIFVLLGNSLAGHSRTQHAHFAAHLSGQYLFAIGFEWLTLGWVWFGLRLRRIRLRSLLGEVSGGWAAIWRDIWIAFLFWIVALTVLGVTGSLLHHTFASAHSPEKVLTALAPHTATQMGLWVLVCISAGICEEFLFRGYLLRQFSSLSKRHGESLAVGVLAASLIFGASHGYEGWATMVLLTLYGLMFCWLILKTKRLRPAIFAHIWHDLFTGIVLASLHASHLHMK